MSGYPDTETAGEHLRNLLALVGALEARLARREYDVDDEKFFAAAIRDRAHAALLKIGHPVARKEHQG